MANSSDSGGGSAQPQSLLFGCAALLVAMAAAAAVLLAYTGLQDWHPPAALTASMTSLNAQTSLTLPGAGSSQPSATWTLTGRAGQLTISGPKNGAQVDLPLPVSYCQSMAHRLHGDCADGRVFLRSGAVATFTWSSDLLVAASGTQVASVVQVIPDLAPANLYVSTTMPTRPVLCFYAPPRPTRLLVAYGAYIFRRRVRGAETLSCDDGLRVVLAPPVQGIGPVLDFARVSSMQVTTQAASADVAGFAGPIVLSPGGTTVVGTPAAVSMHGRGTGAVKAQVNVGDGQPLTLSSGAATSVVTTAGNLVPSAWHRYSDVLGPLLGGVVTALVVAPLGTCVQVFSDVARRRQDWFRRAEARLRRRIRRWRIKRLQRRIKRLRVQHPAPEDGQAGQGADAE